MSISVLFMLLKKPKLACIKLHVAALYHVQKQAQSIAEIAAPLCPPPPALSTQRCHPLCPPNNKKLPMGDALFDQQNHLCTEI